jgi:hypothetical protein
MITYLVLILITLSYSLCCAQQGEIDIYQETIGDSLLSIDPDHINKVSNSHEYWKLIISAANNETADKEEAFNTAERGKKEYPQKNNINDRTHDTLNGIFGMTNELQKITNNNVKSGEILDIGVRAPYSSIFYATRKYLHQHPEVFKKIHFIFKRHSISCNYEKYSERPLINKPAYFFQQFTERAKGVYTNYVIIPMIVIVAWFYKDQIKNAISSSEEYHNGKNHDKKNTY